MPLVPCPECAYTEHPKRCRHCRGTGANLDLISGVFTAPASALAGIRDKCSWCGGDGECKKCGGNATVVGVDPENRETNVVDEDVRPSTSRPRASKLHDDYDEDSYGRSGGGGYVARGSDVSFKDICIAIVVLIILVPIILSAIFSPKKPPPPASLDIAVYDSTRAHFIRALAYEPGTPRQIFFRVSYDSTLGFYTEKPMEVELLQNDRVIFRQLVDHKPFSSTPSNTVIVPYEADFSVGRYVARISAENVKTREYDFSVINTAAAGDAATNRSYWTVSPTVEGHIEIFVTDSFQGVFPGPPKNRMYSLPDSPKWFYIDVHNDGLTPEQGSGVYVTVLREGGLLWREDVTFPPDKNEIYLQWESDGTAGHYLLRAFYNHGQQYLDFPFTLKEGADPSNLNGDTQFHSSKSQQASARGLTQSSRSNPVKVLVTSEMIGPLPGPAIHVLKYSPGHRVVYVYALLEGRPAPSDLPLDVRVFRENLLVYTRPTKIEKGHGYKSFSWSEDLEIGHYTVSAWSPFGNSKFSFEIEP